MKRMIVAAAFMFTAGMVKAQADTMRTKYDYYPDANVYYDDAAHKYWYLDSASNKWQNAGQLPSGYSINEKSMKSSIYFDGQNVWQKNEDHRRKYGTKGKGKKAVEN